MRSSGEISELWSFLPGIAFEKIFYEYLIDEIISTNDIEGVKTTSREIIEAIGSVRKGGNPRLKSFARMYLGIETGMKPKSEL